jgi:2-keto-4-pentenoate hydratase/2-oxohepta-3-ene-1,7-dioic acid hydratase in catechol pathway
VSARDIQFKDNGLTLGKGLDTFCPMGPVIFTADQVPDYRRLRLATYVNGERRQYALASASASPGCGGLRPCGAPKP